MAESVCPELLLDWYKSHRRHLPWREEPTPYHVWLSEIMLQQTRVETVIEYYFRFLEKLPDIGALAAASEDQVFKLWEGLGYYSRARNLMKAAAIIESEYGGEMPKTAAELRTLPGIGDYTSAAIASIAYGEKTPAVDGNLLRIFSRLCGYHKNIRDAEAKREAVLYYESVMDKIPSSKVRQDGRSIRFGDFNQALMDLGATVCLPNTQPLCGQCPFRTACSSHLEMPGSEQELPVNQPKKQRKIEERTVFILQDADYTVLRKRPPKGLLAGLYELPNTERYLTEDEALAYVRELGFEPLRIQPVGEAKHVFSHIEWRMIGYKVRVDELRKMDYDAEDPVQRILLADTDKIRNTYSIPSAFRFYREQIDGAES